MATFSDLPTDNIAESTTAPGIFQGDVIIRSAFVEAIRDLRCNPWLLDYAFASLAQDSLTKKTYGTDEIRNAKEWFQNTKIQVIMAADLNDVAFPCISISELGCQEEGATLGDVNYDVQEDLDTKWTSIIGPTTPVSYDYTTGKITLDPDDVGEKILVGGMVLLLQNGTVLNVVDAEDNVVWITPTTEVLDLNRLFVRSSRPTQAVSLESIRMRENYGLVCAVQGKLVHLTYLQCICKFIYFRYKQRLFEARGFENSKLNFTATEAYKVFEEQLVYQKGFQLSGIVHYFWPKDVMDKLETVEVQTRILGLKTGVTDVSVEPWVGSDDPPSFEDFGKDDPNLIEVKTSF